MSGAYLVLKRCPQDLVGWLAVRALRIPGSSPARLRCRLTRRPHRRMGLGGAHPSSELLLSLMREAADRARVHGKLDQVPPLLNLSANPDEGQSLLKGRSTLTYGSDC